MTQQPCARSQDDSAIPSMMFASSLPRIAVTALFAASALFALGGCGKTISRTATEQLLTSDAVDRSVSQIDFRALTGEKVYLDTTYLQPVKGAGFVNAEYIISSLRQQILAANCLLQEKKEDADYIIEARVGALGTDATEITYGVPANTMLNSAAEIVPAAPALPAIPELALAKKNDQLAAAKIGVFAYDRKTREPVWQAGISKALSDSKDTWLFGAGPFQSGTIHNKTRFAGGALGLPLIASNDDWQEESAIPYTDEHFFGKESDRQKSRPPTTVTYQPSAPAKPAEAPKDAPAKSDKPAEPKKPDDSAAVAERPDDGTPASQPKDSPAPGTPKAANSGVQQASASVPAAESADDDGLSPIEPAGYLRVTDVDSILKGQIRLQSVVRDDVRHSTGDTEEQGEYDERLRVRSAP